MKKCRVIPGPAAPLLGFWLVVSSCIGQEASEEEVPARPPSTPNFFAGGPSDIDSKDDERAAKAIAKWSDPAGQQDGVALTEAPYFWDASKVGRPVFIRVLKNANHSGVLEVWLENPASKKFEFFKAYLIAFYSGTLGPKTAQGDRQAPEGFYFINSGRLNSKSNYHLSMDIGYPNAYDRSLGRDGSFLMIHGSFVSLGCYAMTDCSIEQIYTLVHQALHRGQSIVRVHCFPFAMMKRNMEIAKDHEHFPFWKNLQEGWDWFEKERRPPNVEVSEQGDRYIFTKG